LDLKPNKKIMHYVMSAYATVGDTNGLADVFTRFQAMGLTPISTTFNAVLRCMLNNEDMDWEAFISCYSEHFGFQKLVADIDTYAVLLDGCEKYERPVEAAKYFKQMLATGAYPTTAMRDTFRRTLGDLQFDEFRSGLAPEYQRAMSNIDLKAAPFPGRHSFSSEESLRLSRLQATPLTKRMQPKARTLDNALKGGSSNAGNSASNIGQGSASQLLKSITQTKDTAPIAIAKKDPPSLSALIDLGKRGDIPGLQAMIEELKAEGSIPLSMLMENLICAHMKGFDTASAQRVLDDMKAANIDVSRKSFDYLMEAYSDDGNGPGAELVASQALSMGFALGLSNTPSLFLIYYKVLLVLSPNEHTMPYLACCLSLFTQPLEVHDGL
jgi:pentatricopeptide repeat protein